ncbi:putative pre-mRNA-splicing factor ATP-dependent RNA helicase DEAH4 [Zea mays]|uniref:Putative pre-mRNA-splicing factor ATP-dependent RNA helicase DEAH4 n=1 Tax=Zea mays TaxID=4577 RepID=A0A1D6NU02_MAIZE|nr:putative pre-mRNA-splicing factor ATP-dependent RNA helicase DEAH4 [Zea mays]
MSIVPCDVCVCEFSMDRDPWAKFRRPNSEHPAQSEETRTHQHPGVAGARRPNAMPSPSPAPPPVLPISEHEDEIVAAVDANPVVVVIGETGSGKSTQLSQILHRRGYTRRGAIAVTQPRRVAAVSVSRRVAQELGVPLGDEVGYAIRFEDRTSERTCIKYLTDGILLRESLSNPELKQYSVIILDEAHERSLNTDILLGLMKRLIKDRASDLKVLITSATLDGLKVSKFFSGCPVLNIPGTLFPVEKFYSTDRPTNYIESSLRTAIDIHAKEPPGDVLIFMTGKVRVFAPAPPNCRRFIVATNVAETSLTVDGVVFVIDCGYVKQRQYNPSSGMYSLDVVQISRVQADQRAGRAGRTRPGKCYRLYPISIYQNEFLEATVPEIQRSSLAGSVLYLKSLNLPDINILKFDFLDPPSRKIKLQILYSYSFNHSCGPVRGMKLSKDVRNQLCQIIQKIAKGSTDVDARKSRKNDPDYRKLRRALCVGYGNQLAERMLHHNGYHTVGYRTQLVQVHPSSVLEGDEYGKFPMYVIYHELISTTRPYMRNVCAVEQAWVQPILKKLDKLDINRLSGGSSAPGDSELLGDNKQVNSSKNDVGVKQSEVDSKIQAARERYLARKGKK